MRLQAVRNGTVYASAGSDLLVGDGDGEFERTGRLPPPAGGRAALPYRLLTSNLWRPVFDRIVGAVSTANVWPLSSTDLLATVRRRVLVSDDRGRHWTETHRLPESAGTMGVLPSAVTHRDGTTYLGEYPLDTRTTPRILASPDLGRTWTTKVSLPSVRHVHAVQRDPYTDDIWVTTGDRDAESRIGRLRDGAVETVGGGSQQWRAVELAFTPRAILWGMDCAYADENRIFKLPRTQIGTEDPTPEPVHTAPGSVFYSASLSVDGDHWVVFSSAMEAGSDSTGPTNQTARDDQGVVLASSSASGFEAWQELASFRRRRCLTDYLPGGLPRASGYVFLAADPDRGLFLNPYNTASADGSIHRIGLDRFEPGN